MPPRGQGPHLYLRRERRDRASRVTHPAVWLVRDGRYSESTRCGIDDRGSAEEWLAEYIARKHVTQAQIQRRADQIPVADALALYARDVAAHKPRPKEAAFRIGKLLEFFRSKRLSQINGSLCRSYAEHRGAPAAARRELEDLRAAVNHYRKEGYCREIVSVTLPPRAPSRERWLTRGEAAKLLWAAWRYRERQHGRETDRRSRQHVARFILVALYTGTRAGAVCSAALQPTAGHSWIDLAQGMFYRRAQGRAETKKRQPPIPLPRRLLAHLRRWKRQKQRFVVEWNGEPVIRMAKAFRETARAAGLADVTPHILRHTAATWLMQAGVSVWQASGYLGMSVETLSRIYGHHHRDHLQDAVRAFEGGHCEVKEKSDTKKKRRARLGLLARHNKYL